MANYKLSGALAGAALLVTGGIAEAQNVTLTNNGGYDIIDLSNIKAPGVTATNTGNDDLIKGHDLTSGSGQTYGNTGNKDVIDLSHFTVAGAITGANNGSDDLIVGRGVTTGRTRSSYGQPKR